ncbi:MAG TPA: hypothetical protein DD438_07105 [Verrucomicrobiales bacterium]|nr:hypothetical protein [Verrucomicrobiales bacterium]HCQ39487.1 hypothetical protein [Verrucomicrobiales bacterium]
MNVLREEACQSNLRRHFRRQVAIFDLVHRMVAEPASHGISRFCPAFSLPKIQEVGQVSVNSL